MKGFNVTSILLYLTVPAMLIAFALDGTAETRSSTGAANGTSDRTYRLHDGRIIRTSIEPDSVVPVPGRVSCFYSNEDALYYIFSRSGSGVAHASIGMLCENGQSIYEVLPAPFDSLAVVKMVAEGGIAYIMAGDDRDGLCVYRINLNTMDMSRSCNAMDVVIVKGLPVLIEKEGINACVNINGIRVPISLNRGLSFSHVIDERFAVITDGAASELVDLSGKKSLLIYSDKRSYAVPVRYNLKIMAVDDPSGHGGKGEKDTVFYKIFINGVEAGRTVTGKADIPAVYRGSRDPGSYYSITVERWVLNRARKRYKRANNIMQPGSFRLYLPAGRITVIELYHDHDGYRISRDFE